MYIEQWVGCIVSIIVLLPAMAAIVLAIKQVLSDLKTRMLRKVDAFRWMTLLISVFSMQTILLVNTFYIIFRHI